MIANLWMSWMSTLHEKNETTPKNVKKQQIKEY